MSKHYHFIGIGGTGLSAIARVLLEQGNTVSGSDMILSPLALEIQQAGAMVYEGHRAEQVQDADIVIRSSAINDDNVEVQAALHAGIPVLKRIDFLAELTKGRTLIAVAGTHGKTTTTAMTAWVFDQLHLNPTYIIGGTAKNLQRNAHAGSGQYFIIEADEYDSMFLGLSPDYLIITNIEHDHPDCYPTQDSYLDAFKKLIERMKAESTALICADDTHAHELGLWAEDRVNVHFYGASAGVEYPINSMQHVTDRGVSFNLRLSNGKTLHQELVLPGEYNARNAAAVLALTDQLKLSVVDASKALAGFSGTGRRFDILGTFRGITLIDDYGHHPTEIRSTIHAARAQYPDRRLIAVWQPHTYSRTRELFQDYLEAFTDCDMVIVTEIYASREKKQEYSSALVASQIHHKNVHFIATLQETTAFLKDEGKAGDVVLILSAGDANQINQDLKEYLTQIIRERGENV